MQKLIIQTVRSVKTTVYDQNNRDLTYGGRRFVGRGAWRKMMHCACVYTKFNYFSHVADRRRRRNRCFQVVDEMASAQEKRQRKSKFSDKRMTILLLQQ